MENLVVQKQGEIKCDFEAIKDGIKRRLDEYRGAVFTEGSKNIAKKEVANLRKEKKEFSDRVRDAKNEYMKPYLEFESKAKELISLYDEPIDLISSQIQEFEEKRREEKRNLIADIYAEESGDMSEYVTLSKIYNKKWENATCREKEIRSEIQACMSSASQAIETIKAMQSPDENEAIRIYLKDFNITEAVAFINERAKVRADAVKREQERKAREEEERIRREEREKIREEQRKQEELERMKAAAEKEKQEAVEEARAEAVEALIPELSGETNLYEYRMSLTVDAKQKLEMYMNSVGIEWELI